MIDGRRVFQGEIEPQFVPPLNGIVIVGKYGPGEQPIFDLKNAFLAAGVDVAAPIGGPSEESYHGYVFTHPLEKYIPFHDLQWQFLRQIEENAPFVPVCTDRIEAGQPVSGFLGLSTAYEMAWAALHSKPIILTSAVTDTSPYVPQSILDVLEKVIPRCYVQNPSQLSIDGLKAFLGTLPEKIDYNLNDDETIWWGIKQLHRIEMHRWLSWTQKTRRDYEAGKSVFWVNDQELALYEEPAAYLPWGEMMSDPDARAYLPGAVIA